MPFIRTRTLGLRNEERQARHCTQSLGSWGDLGCQLGLGVASAQYHPLSELLSELENVMIGSGEQETYNRVLGLCCIPSPVTGTSDAKKTSHPFLGHPETIGD